jgi:magnesium transporter
VTAGRTAEELAVTAVPQARPDETAGTARERLVEAPFDLTTELAVCEGEILRGVVPIERLLAASPSTPLIELLEEPPTVEPCADREAVALLAATEACRAVAVVDDQGRFRGLVPAVPLLVVLREEHEEDLARLVGMRSAATNARSASEEPVHRRLWHRLPWLGVGLLGAMGASAIVGAFEVQLRKEVLLALFVPAVVYMADAVGTQTETVVIRGVAVGVPISQVFRRELAAGIIIGALVGLAFFPFVVVAWGDARIAATAAIALFVSSSVATMVAMVLPYALVQAGQDPAFGSGPLATVIQDLLSILVYFAVALVLVE